VISLSERSGEAPVGEPAPLLSLRGIKKYFKITRGVLFQKHVGNVHAVDGVDLDVFPGDRRPGRRDGLRKSTWPASLRGSWSRPKGR
jgi:hypothetical protein